MTDDKTTAKVLVIHGPNLNMLGMREPDKYGYQTLEEIDSEIVSKGAESCIKVETFQSNSEGDIVTKIQKSIGRISGLIINPAAYTHTSVAIRDALVMLDVPVIEVHLSNIYKREAFRHTSYVSGVATGQISGLGSQGYLLALSAIANLISN